MRAGISSVCNASRPPCRATARAGWNSRRRPPICCSVTRRSGSAPLLGKVADWEFHRGLIRHVTVDAETFLAHAEAWLPALPLVGVYLRKAKPHIAALAACPQLIHLNGLYLGDNNLADEDVQKLLASRHLRRLTTLYLQSNRFGQGELVALGSFRLGAEGMRTLASWPLLQRLRFLELHNSSSHQVPGLEALASSPNLGGLLRLDIHNGHPAPEGRKALRERMGGRFSPVGRRNPRTLYIGGFDFGADAD